MMTYLTLNKKNIKQIFIKKKKKKSKGVATGWATTPFGAATQRLQSKLHIFFFQVLCF
jgi:hypothetical protein